jgi:hypothetical protein
VVTNVYLAEPSLVSSPAAAFHWTSAVVMRGLDQLVSQLTVMRECEQSQGEPEQAVPQVRGTLVVDEGGYRQVQREPNAHDFQIIDIAVNGWISLGVHGSQGAKARSVCMNAMHNLELALIEVRKCFRLLSVRCSEFPKIKMRRCAMLVALEVNFALWIMIGCGVAEIVHFVGYLS